MKTPISILVFILGLQSIQAQVATFSMENWTTFFGGTNPTGWVSSNVLTSNATVAKDSIVKHGGNYSARVTTGVLNPNPLSAYMPDTNGFMLTGALNLITLKIQQGFSFTSRADTLGVWAKYAPQNGDEGFIYVALTKRNALGTGSRDTVASGTLVFTAADSIFSFHKIALDYNTFSLPPSTLPDSAIVLVSSSRRVGGIPGSKIWVDDFEWDPATGTSLSTKELQSVGVYPCPAADAFVIIAEGLTGNKTAEIIDQNGKILVSYSFSGPRYYADLRTVSPGNYALIVKDQKGNQAVERFIVAR